jgi:hypothetical protein
MKIVPLETLTLATFTGLLQTQFRAFINPSTDVPLELAQALPAPVAAKGSLNGQRYESFSLIFHGPESPLLQQGTRPFEHDQLGRFELFIVPIGRENGVIKYEAVFNRLLRPD